MSVKQAVWIGVKHQIKVWFSVTDQLGYSPEGGSGWCTLKVHDEDGKQNIFAVVFGNDLWIYLTFITVTILYFSVHCHIKFQVSGFCLVLINSIWLKLLYYSLTKFTVKRNESNASRRIK